MGPAFQPKAWNELSAFARSSVPARSTTLGACLFILLRAFQSVDRPHSYVIAEQPRTDGSGKRARPYETVKPLADDLGLPVHIQCDKEDPDCVADAIQDYAGSGPGQNSLVCWSVGV